MSVVKLRDVAQVISGQHILETDHNQLNQGIGYLTGPADFGLIQPTISRWTEKPKVICEPEDILMTVKGAGVGKINLAPETPVAIGRQLMAIRGNENFIDTYFLFLFLFNQLAYFQEKAVGATVPGLSREDLESLFVPLPPIEKQRQIAARLKAQLAEVDKARQAAEKQLRELNLALNQILEEQINNAITKGKESIRLGEVTSITAKIINPTLAEYCDFPHISAENIESMTGRLINVKSAKEDGMTSGKYLFDEGDILYSKLRPYLRKVSKANFKGLCSADMYPIKVDENRLDVNFLKFLLTSNLFTDYANEKSARSRMPKLNREQLSEFEFKLPSIDHQQDCVKKTNEALICVAQATKSAKVMLRDINLLPKKILAQAFGDIQP